jgi:hypothetical protein
MADGADHTKNQSMRRDHLRNAAGGEAGAEW